MLAVLDLAVVGPVLVGGAVVAEQRLGGPVGLKMLFTGFGAGSPAGLLAAGLCPATAVGQSERLLLGVEGRGGDDGPEHILALDRRVLGDAGEQRRLQEGAPVDTAESPGDRGGTVGDAPLDVTGATTRTPRTPDELLAIAEQAAVFQGRHGLAHAQQRAGAARACHRCRTPRMTRALSTSHRPSGPSSRPK